MWKPKRCLFCNSYFRLNSGSQRYCKNCINKRKRIIKSLNNIHAGILKRCYDKKSRDYQWYGNRGISLCIEWKNVRNFEDWALKNGFEIGLTIDRVNPNLGYQPDNCKWTTIQKNLACRKFKNIFGNKRRCTNCQEIKLKTLFHKNKNGYHSVCKLCRSRLRANGVRKLNTLYADPK